MNSSKVGARRITGYLNGIWSNMARFTNEDTFTEAKKAYKKIRQFGPHNLIGGYLTPTDQQVLNWLRFELAAKPFIDTSAGEDYDGLLQRFEFLSRSALRMTMKRLVDFGYLKGSYLGKITLPEKK